MAGVVPEFQHPPVCVTADDGQTGAVQLKPPQAVVGEVQQAHEERSKSPAVGYYQQVVARVMLILNSVTEAAYAVKDLRGILTTRSGKGVVLQTQKQGEGVGVLGFNLFGCQALPLAVVRTREGQGPMSREVWRPFKMISALF